MDFLENKFFLLAITFGFFFVSKLLQKKTGWVIINPILIAIALLICFLKVSGVSYEKYQKAGELIEFWLKPAVVALGVPLYLQLRMIKKQLMPYLTAGRMSGGTCLGGHHRTGNGGLSRNRHLTGSKVGHYPYRHGGIDCHSRYSFTDGSRGDCSRSVRCHLRV